MIVTSVSTSCITCRKVFSQHDSRPPEGWLHVAVPDAENPPLRYYELWICPGCRQKHYDKLSYGWNTFWKFIRYYQPVPIPLGNVFIR